MIPKTHPGHSKKKKEEEGTELLIFLLNKT